MTRSPQRRTVLVAAGVIAVGGIATGTAIAAGGADATGGSPVSATSATSSATSSAALSGTPRVPGPRGPGGHGPRAVGKYDADGTVTAVSTGSLTVRSLFGTSSTYVLTSKTTVHDGTGTNASIASIDVNDHVAVHGTKISSGVRADSVDIRSAHIEGAITDITGDRVIVTDRDGFTRQITVSSDTTYTLDGSKSSKSSLKAGRVVQAEGSVDSDGVTLDATQVQILTKAPARPVAGPAGQGGPRPPAPGHPGRRPAGAAPSSGSGRPS